MASAAASAATQLIAKKVPSLLDPQPVVKVVVGKSKSIFFVHKNFLCYYSPYFAAALREGAFKESESQTIELEHLEPDVFGIFVTWLYTQTIPVIHGSTEPPAIDQPSFGDLALLWILADYLMIPKLQNLAIKELLLKFKRTRSHPVTVYVIVYENTGSGSLLRKLFVDLVVWEGYGDETYFTDNPQLFEKQMLLELAVAWNLWRINGCKQSKMKNPLWDVKNYYVKEAIGDGNSK